MPRRLSLSTLLLMAAAPLLSAAAIPLQTAVVVVRPGPLMPAEQTAATVLIDEIAKRTGVRLTTSTQWPAGKPVIALSSQTDVPGWPRKAPSAPGKPEGYRLLVDESNASTPVVWITGADPRGTLFGVGDLLRKTDYDRNQLRLPSHLDVTTAPASRIRGHQLGYRAQANSYDAWSVAQFEQYIRELSFFGVNSIESIPFQDERPTPVMKVPRREMNRALSEICHRYGLDYWAWIPADFDLRNQPKRERMLRDLDEFFKDSPELTGLFFPGGDPGDNPPEQVLPFLKEIAGHLKPHHPKAKIWLSLQMFSKPQIDYVFDQIQKERPEWLGGLVAGPSSPDLALLRRRLPQPYGLRDYPDVTHNKLSQYEVPLWDQAYALTLGREAINPRPEEYARHFQQAASQTDGFITYSDGAHDDVNKIVWSALSWDPSRRVRDILVEYSRVYFAPSVAEQSAEGILRLEKNWHGPLLHNQTVPATLQFWQRLEKSAPQLGSNWRWQMCLLRAYYDAYTQSRLQTDTKLEQEANAILRQARSRGSNTAMNDAAAVLNKAVEQPPRPELLARIVDLCERLYQSIGLQTSVDKYHAINPERGAVLDFVAYPLNNRWWLEDEFKKVRQLPSEEERVRRLTVLANWEAPGAGSFYDAIGDIAKSPHVHWENPDGSVQTPTYWWWDLGKSRARLTWQVTMWPHEMVYQGLTPSGSYVLRTSGYGQALPRADGQRLTPAVNGREMGEFKEFPIPAEYVKDGKLVITWDPVPNEEALNWRKKSRLAEVWLLKVK